MMQATQTFTTTVAADPLPLWSTILTVASTVVLAIFAGVQLEVARRHRNADDKRAAQERADRQAAADARVSALAFALRRQLRSWIGSPHVNTDWVAWAREVKPDLPKQEERLHAMLAEADASPNIKHALRGALMPFYHAMDTLDRTKTEGTLSGEEAMLIGVEMPRPEREMAACADLLEFAIDAELMQADKDWADWWKENSPLARYIEKRLEAPGDEA